MSRDNRRLESQADYLNTIAAMVTVAGFTGGPILAILANRILPWWQWLPIGAGFVAVGILLHLAARRTLRRLR